MKMCAEKMCTNVQNEADERIVEIASGNDADASTWVVNQRVSKREVPNSY